MNRIRNLLLVIQLALFVSACNSPMDSTYRLENITGYTLMADGELKSFKALAIQNGKVLMAGSLEEVREALPNALVEDGEGKVLLPGLIDAHAHVMGLGMLLMEVDVTGLPSLEETLEAVRVFAEKHPDEPWILGRGWNQVLWDEKEFPTAQDLDKVVPDRPVFLSRVDGHAAWTNTKAMELSGVSRDTPDSRGGRLIRTLNGDPTGVFIDEAEQVITRMIPEKTLDQNRQALRAALEEMSRYGLTGVHDAGISAGTWDLFQEFDADEALPVRIYAMVGGINENTQPLLDAGPLFAQGDDRLALRSVKLYSDGALGSRGAALLHDYHDDPGNKGLLFYTDEEMTEFVTTVLSKGFQANVHAIGDAANRQVLDALKAAQKAFPTALHGDHRNRVEHAQVVSPADISRFSELNLIASMQPTHATSDKNMAGDRLGEKRLDGAYAWKTFLNQGTRVAAGSDFPVEHVNPFYGLYSAITRQDHENNPPGGWLPEEKLSRIEALRAFTLDAAFSGFDEDRTGSLEPGKQADFILIDGDYFELPASEIWKIQVLETRISGKTVYKADTP